MIIVDLGKAERRRTDRRRHQIRRTDADGKGILSRIATLQHAVDARVRTGDRDGYIAGRRELCNLIFAVVSDEVNSGVRR